MFSGEKLKCKECGFEQMSDPNIESGWYKIRIDGKYFNICPDCMNPGRTPKCSNCHKFYHEDYGKTCPWCGHKKSNKYSWKL